MSLKGDEFAQIVRIPVDRGVKSTKKHKPNQKKPENQAFCDYISFVSQLQMFP